MKIRGTLKGVARDWVTDKFNITLEMNEGNIGELDRLKDKDLSVELKIFREARSNKANRLLWECLGEIARDQHLDKWDLYLKALRHYGQYTLVDMEPGAVKHFQSIYRECEIVGSKTTNGKEMLQVLCYFGSSSYDSKEFSILLDGVIQDMKDLELPTPTSQEMRRAIEELENEEKAN